MNDSNISFLGPLPALALLRSLLGCGYFGGVWAPRLNLMGSQQSEHTGGSQERDQALDWLVDGRDGRQHSDPLRFPVERFSKSSEFVLVPVTDAARNSCSNLHRRGDGAAPSAASASAAVATTTATTAPPPPPARIHLLDGDNIVGTGSAYGLGLGIPAGTKVRQHVYLTYWCAVTPYHIIRSADGRCRLKLCSTLYGVGPA